MLTTDHHTLKKILRELIILTSLVLLIIIAGILNAVVESIKTPALKDVKDAKEESVMRDSATIIIPLLDTLLKEKTPRAPSGKPPQFVVLSFDGSKSNETWKEIRAFASEMKEKSAPLHFTFFISAVYLLNPENANTYSPPGHDQGDSQIGFSEGPKATKERIRQINAAFSEGHEIASHAAGHFNGMRWSYEDWKKELSFFDDLIFNVQANNSIIEKIALGKSDIIGFRAPELGANSAMMKALADSGYLYDASGVGYAHLWPKKNAAGIWEFPLMTITFVHSGANTISMDYSMYVDQTQGKDLAKKGTELWNTLYTDIVDTYTAYFNKNYQGNRAPISIGHHFTMMNDGVYWEAMKSFAREVCGKPEVICGSYRDLVQYLGLLTPETIATFEKGDLFVK
jgi:hypothetical protein